ncbi:MAG: DUF192 domain-containing protein [Candidatus Omnitrophica bacterium]|nr:DUF192 domain-containing protein [Candidatus Omnitrophota bacterium]
MKSILNQTQQTLLAENAKIADSFMTRMVGLLNRKFLSQGEALIITRCQSIHMVFMRFSIDAVFADKHDSVVGLVKNIKPYQFSSIFFKASYVIELPVGTIDRTKTGVGDLLQIQN